MGYYEVQSATISCDYPESIDLNEAIAMFADALFKEGYLNVSTKYNKETGELYRELSISANKKIFN